MEPEQAIYTLICWAQKYNFDVVIIRGGDDSIDEAARVIEINSSNSIETQLYVLLHECGHLLIYNNDDALGTRDVVSKFSERTKMHRVFRVVEEVDAWKRGKLLAKRLGIIVNDEKWNRVMVRALKKYMEWVVY